MALVLDVVRAVRNLRRERNIDAGRWIEAYVVADVTLAKHAPAIEQLARVRPLHVVSGRADAPSDSVATAVLDGATVVLPMAGLFDSSAERANLEKQRDQARKMIEGLESASCRTKVSRRARLNNIVAAELEPPRGSEDATRKH